MHMRSFEEMLDEVETANDGDGPDPLSTYSGPNLAELAAAIEIRASADRAIEAAVHNARSEGATWQSIGDLLGMTRQGALKRYGRVAGSHPGRRTA